MIKAVIIDDEQDSIDTLVWKLENYCPEVRIIATFDTPSEGISYLRSNDCQLLFLDIEMPLLSGFDVLEELGSALSFEIIFTTAYDNFGIQAVKNNALDYLLKPIQNKELKEAIKKFKIKSRGKSVVELIDENANSFTKSNKIALASKESIEFVEAADIIVCMASSNYTTLFMTDGRKKLISKTLREFQEMLKPYPFFRPHNSHLVNLNFIREYIRSDGGYLIMHNDMKIPVSKNKKEELLSLLSV